MLRVRACAAHMGGFWVQKSLNRGLFCGRFSLNMVGFLEIGKKLSKMGSFPPNFIIKVLVIGN